MQEIEHSINIMFAALCFSSALEKAPAIRCCDLWQPFLFRGSFPAAAWGFTLRVQGAGARRPIPEPMPAGTQVFANMPFPGRLLPQMTSFAVVNRACVC